jgi:hypothetical protein
MNRKKIICRTCGGEMVQKSRARLFFVGALMFSSVPLAFFIPYFWVPEIVVVLTGGYLLLWASLGQGCWCRNCKQFKAIPDKDVV